MFLEKVNKIIPKKLTLDTLISLCILLIIFLIPLIGYFNQFSYELTKVLVFIILMCLLILFYLLKNLKYPQKIKFTKIKLISLIFIISLSISSFLGINPIQSILGTSPYFQGLIVYIFLFFFSVIVSISELSIFSYATFLSLSSIFVSILAIKDFLSINLFNISVPTYAGRVVSSFGQPNLYSGFILLTLPFNLLLLSKKINSSFPKFIALFNLTLGSTAIFISFSRASTLILLIFFYYIFIQIIQQKYRKIFIILTTIIVLFTIILSIKLSSGIISDELVRSGNLGLINNSVEKRIFIWQIISQIASRKIFLGYGLENIGLVYSNFFQSINFNTQKDVTYFIIKNLIVDRSHNYILDLLTFAGLFGLTSWLYLIYLLIKKVKSQILFISLLIYLLWIQFQIQSIVHLIYFYLLVGLIDQI